MDGDGSRRKFRCRIPQPRPHRDDGDDDVRDVHVRRGHRGRDARGVRDARRGHGRDGAHVHELPKILRYVGYRELYAFPER